MIPQPTNLIFSAADLDPGAEEYVGQLESVGEERYVMGSFRVNHSWTD